MTKLLFREDAYLKTHLATVTALTEKEGVKGVILDQTCFYATAGGQAGDSGKLTVDGKTYIILTAVYDETKANIIHILEGGETPSIGETGVLSLDWEKRYAKMKLHTGLHLLSVVLPFPVTGGSINEKEGRLDFDIPENTSTKEELSEKLNALISKNASISETYITDSALEANPSLVKTMSVKPPMGSGKVRLVKIKGLDLQPCGGTHVKNTSEIGVLQITQIEKKGKLNRRIRVSFV